MDGASIQLVSFAIATLTLVCASYFDLMTRKVPNAVWLPPMLAGALSTPLMVRVGVLQAEEAALSVASALFLAYLLFRLRILGGADCKAIIVTCLLTPVGRNPIPLNFFPLALVTNLFIMLGALTLAITATCFIRRGLRRVLRRETGDEAVFSWRKFSPPLMPLMALSLLVSFFFGNLALATTIY